MIVHKFKKMLPQNSVIYRLIRSLYINFFRKVFYRPFLYLLPRDKAHKIMYSDYFGVELPLSNPKDFNHKIHWLIVYKFGEREAELYDKYRAKQYVKKLGIPDLHVAELYTTFRKASDIDISKLPDKFVLKTAHGCSHTFICVDKSIFNLKEAKRHLAKALRTNYERQYCEYFSVKTTKIILCEEYIDDHTETIPLNYKFHCINGKTIIIDIIRKIGDVDTRFDCVDSNWESIDCCVEEPISKGTTQKPLNFERMLEIAEELAKPFPWVRIDLFNANGKVFFGEYTFTPFNGNIENFNQKTLDHLGELLDLSLYN